MATSRSYQRLRSCSISVLEMRPEKITVSIGNFSRRKCVLKKWKVKMKPAASRASSRVDDQGDVDDPARQEAGEEHREPHDQARTAPMMATPQNTAK